MTQRREENTPRDDPDAVGDAIETFIVTQSGLAERRRVDMGMPGGGWCAPCPGRVSAYPESRSDRP